MKKILIAFTALLFYSSFAQVTNTIDVQWKSDNFINFDSYKIKVPHFQLNNFYFDEGSNEIFFNQKITVENTFDENNIRIINVTYEPISIADLGVLNQSKIPSSINFEVKNSRGRDVNYAFIQFSPIVKNNNSFRKVTSITYSFNYSSSERNQTLAVSDYLGIRNSVLSTGEWYRFYVEKSGVYRISRSFLSQLGMNTNTDPRKIKIYGNGGRMLPLLNSVEYPIDLEENAIQFIGEEDGVFDTNDYILFYAEGVENWNQESLTNLNLYDSKSYYYVTSSGGDGKRIQNSNQPEGNPTLIISKFNDYQFFEKDEINIGRLGRVWYGSPFSFQNSQEYQFNFPNIDTSVPLQISFSAAAEAFVATSMNLSLNGQNIQTFNFNPVIPTSSVIFDNLSTSFTTTAPSQNISIQVTYNNNGIPTARGYLNYINITAVRNLAGIGKQFEFKSNQVASQIGIGEYQITNANGITQIWDVTDRFNVSSYVNNNQSVFTFKTNLGDERKYIALDPSDFYIPRRDSQSKVVNQNLKGTIFNNNSGQFSDIDYLIITPTNLIQPAEKLANFHRNYSNLNVKVVPLDFIYQEFSSGKQDIAAIRNFIRYIYYNASAPSKRVKYVNLFGDTSFDYKNRIPNNTNITPIFHSLNSNNLLSSTMSDDFFAMMDENEGRMLSSADIMDLAVGRMLVDNIAQAYQMVDKVIDYHDIKSYGRWRNNFTLISDDVDESWEVVIQQQLDNLGNNIGIQKPEVNVIKIHTDSYVQETSAGGQRYPKAKEDIINAFNQGSLVFNYFGHGGEEVLAKERIFEKTDAQNLNNQYKYPLFVTVTCEFTRFDNPYRPTAGEYTYWNPKGGAISLVTTTRRIGVTTGQDINNFLASFLYGFNSNDEITISEALRMSKNAYGPQTLMVFYVGDPALKLAIPKPKVVLTHINNEPSENSEFIFKALSSVTLSGEVRDPNTDLLITNFNGDLAVQIFDKEINRTTLGNDNVTLGGQLLTMNFTTLGETIFRGNASINNGKFEFSFVVPRDITIPIGNGRISFYAKTEQPFLQDKSGYNTTIKVGGINENAPVDNTGPTVRLYMNDETFISGGITNENPIFLAFLQDENGINTASGIGHDIIAILDGNESNPYILNDYYETELDDFTSGKVRFPFRNLAKGLHTITFRAWDVYNNPVTAEIQFIVVGDDTVTLTNVLNYPNPFVNYTQFWFTHNKPFEPLDVQVQIMTITGKIVKTINQSIATEGFLSREITWDGKDDFGDKIGKGVYIYKLTVKSNITNKKTEKIEKLVIL
ncbi:type IX secretion system sortase PorU [Flavobacterium sp. UBA6135]|uniref:type IX secretion system sortase PorU n=1 Tax=Flavobacterium sp. UBA6135 TaxID=1946553 RepID=UPI0025BE4355|nr:type IX secretion system sortase PorU [Flavobacterium sp. UBA6135]